MRCLAACTASGYMLNGLHAFFRKHQHHTHLLKHMLYVRFATQGYDVFFFSNGCYVAWGIPQPEEETLLKQIFPFSSNIVDTQTHRFIVQYEKKKTCISTHNYFNVDLVSLELSKEAAFPTELVFSYAFAYSIKLKSYEIAIQKIIVENSKILKNISKYGKMSISSEAILKHIGEVFTAKNVINLNDDDLGVADYLWENGNVENYYTEAERFLDIGKRRNILDKKLSTINDVFIVLNHQLQHKHSILLEWIVIILIFLEIVINLIHYYF